MKRCGCPKKKDAANKNATIEKETEKKIIEGLNEWINENIDPKFIREAMENKDEDNEIENLPSLTDVIAEGEPGFDIPKIIRGKYRSDIFFKDIVINPTHFKDFAVEKGLIFLTVGGKKALCIPNLKIKGRNMWEITISHTHSILAHLGAKKTLTYLRDNMWWPKMIDDVTAYCQTCNICGISKSDNQKPMGLL